MNIQHLESLSDVVAADHRRASPRARSRHRARARRTRCCWSIWRPPNCIERLKEGKVYLPDNAKRAADSFFRLGNLTALREMALRRTADRVDDQMVDYLKQNAIEGPWQTAERLLVCIGPDPLSEKVVRTAARLASGLNAPWLVVSIERADRPTPPVGEARSRLDATFKLAESLGAETRRVTGQRFRRGNSQAGAAREHATQIVIGGRTQRFPLSLLRKSLPDALIERVSGLGHPHRDSRRQRAATPPGKADGNGRCSANPRLELGLPVLPGRGWRPISA